MRLRAALFLLPLWACARSPYAAFDAGYDVHVIVRAEPQPKKSIRVRPVCTLGPQVAKAADRRIGAQAEPAAEVAVFRAPQGRHRLALWEPRTWTDARADLDVDRELWVVVTLRPREKKGRLRVYDRPPDDAIGAWRPLVAVPD